MFRWKRLDKNTCTWKLLAPGLSSCFCFLEFPWTPPPLFFYAFHPSPPFPPPPPPFPPPPSPPSPFPPPPIPPAPHSPFPHSPFPLCCLLTDSRCNTNAISFCSFIYRRLLWCGDLLAPLVAPSWFTSYHQLFIYACAFTRSGLTWNKWRPGA